MYMFLCLFVTSTGYRFFAGRFTHQAAYTKCRDEGIVLARPQTDAGLTQLQTIARQNAVVAWTGLTILEVDRCGWNDRWNVQQQLPDVTAIAHDQSCVAMNGNGMFHNEDLTCAVQRAAICQPMTYIRMYIHHVYFVDK